MSVQTYFHSNLFRPYRALCILVRFTNSQHILAQNWPDLEGISLTMVRLASKTSLFNGRGFMALTDNFFWPGTVCMLIIFANIASCPDGKGIVSVFLMSSPYTDIWNGTSWIISDHVSSQMIIHWWDLARIDKTIVVMRISRIHYHQKLIMNVNNPFFFYNAK